MITVREQGGDALQEKLHKTARAFRPGGNFDQAIRDATARAHRYAVSVTHVDTGSLRRAHTMQVSGFRGEVFINPSAMHPQGKRPAEYGIYEHARGGSHAFYARTISEAGTQIMQGVSGAVLRLLR